MAIILFIIYMFVIFCILTPSFRHSKDALTRTYNLSFAEKNKIPMLEKIEIELVVNIFNK